MTVTLPEIREVDQSVRMRGGLLRGALPAPEGWENGIQIEYYSCGEPTVLEACVVAEDEPKEAGPAGVFRPIPVRQGAVCSTISRAPLAKQAGDRLDSTIEWAIGRQLATDFGNVDNPSFADADILGTVAGADFATAIGCLEQAAVDTGFGIPWVLHAPVRAGGYLVKDNLLLDGLSPNGAPIILSPGYPVQGATTVRLWITGPVWAATGPNRDIEAVDWRKNTAYGWADRLAIAGFNPCINIAVDVTVPACPTP